MWVFNTAVGKIFEFLFFPFRSLGLWAGMIFISFLTGLFMLFVFRYTSNQEGIRKVKNKIKAHLLEIRLFKESFSTSLRAQGSILRYNLKYISYSAKPMLIMIIPLILIIIQLNFWFGYQSLSQGEKALLKVKLKDHVSPLQLQMNIESSPGFEIETPPLRIEEEREIDWRLRAKEKGIHHLVISLDGLKLSKRLAVDQKPLSRIFPRKVGQNLLDQVLYPGETPLPSNSPLEAIIISYPAKNMNLFGWRIHWLIVYFALSIIFGFCLKGVLGVEI